MKRGENLEVALERDGEGLKDKLGGCTALPISATLEVGLMAEGGVR